ncbi:MAG: IS66 family insertion sequence element accessory protein TnpB [Betaproteobacteria bacterium]|nr:IS66 family insertion sequence element accessory protein TnpB [Candidatus Dechloromonas phosphorivorans]
MFGCFPPAMFRLDSRLVVFQQLDVDGRKSINGLALLAEQRWGLGPVCAVAFVFSNRRREPIKILPSDRRFWLLIKRPRQIASMAPRSPIPFN